MPENSGTPWTADPKAHTAPWLDKSLWLVILGFLLPILNRRFGLGLEPEEVFAALAPIATFIAMSKWKQGRVTVPGPVAGPPPPGSVVNRP